MVGDLEGFRHTPAKNFQSAGEDPVGVHQEAAAAPRRRAGGERRRITARLEKAPRLEAFPAGKRIEIAKNQGWKRGCFGVCGDHFELRELSVRGGVRIDVSVEDPYLARAYRECHSHREPRTPGTLLPRQ